MSMDYWRGDLIELMPFKIHSLDSLDLELTLSICGMAKSTNINFGSEYR